jgi:peroxiredoxin
MHRPRWSTAFALAFAVTLGCLSAAPKEPARIRATIQEPQRREVAPAFRLSDASGKTATLSKFRGRVVLLDFWATECGGCIVEIPSFMEIAAKKTKDLAVVGVSMDIFWEDLKSAEEGWQHVRPFVKTHGVNYPILMGDDKTFKAYKLDALPVTLLLDKKGRIAAKYAGVVDKSNIEENIRLLARER